MDRYVVALGELHGTDLQHLGPQARELEHLVVGDALELAGTGDDSRVTRIDAVDVRIDLARLRPERGRERDGAGVRAAAAERRDPALAVHPLEAGDDRHRPRRERLLEPLHVHPDDARPSVGAVGLDAHLVAEEGAGGDPDLLEGERGERGRDLLAGRDQGVALPIVRRGCDGARQAEEPVRLARHGAHHDDHLVPSRPARGDPLCHRADAIHVGDGGPPELLHHERHRSSRDTASSCSASSRE